MNIIDDVQRDLAELRGKTDVRALRKFGLLVGAVLLALAAWFWWGRHHGLTAALMAGPGAALVLFGMLAPALLRQVYFVWMGVAMTLGWLVSRVLLVTLFVFIVTPIGLLARVTGKRFLDLPKPGERETMWIPRTRKREPDYTRMY